MTMQHDGNVLVLLLVLVLLNDLILLDDGKPHR